MGRLHCVAWESFMDSFNVMINLHDQTWSNERQVSAYILTAHCFRGLLWVAMKIKENWSPSMLWLYADDKYLTHKYSVDEIANMTFLDYIFSLVSGKWIFANTGRGDGFYYFGKVHTSHISIRVEMATSLNGRKKEWIALKIWNFFSF